MKPVFAHIIEPNNTGDANCCPRRFFPHWADCSETDYHDVSIEDTSPLIVGGGGMLHPGIDTWIHQISQVRPTIVWGIGLNYHEPVPPPGWESHLEHCKLVGLRDYPPLTGKFKWAPCPSCLDTSFDLPDDGKPRKELICYSHWQLPIGIPGIDNFTNHREDTAGIRQFVGIVRDYRYVLTNSYHGALWTIFAGRVPIVWRNFALRFVTALPPEVLRATQPVEVEDYVLARPSIYNPLKEYRRATRVFYYHVESYLARWGCE